MAQIDNLFTAIWHDTTTGPGTPLTGLSATITIREKPSNNIVVNNQAMTEVGLGEYDYTFTGMDVTKAYSYVMNPNSASAYVETGLVDPRDAYMDSSISEIRGWGGGGFSINYQAINSHTTNKVNELKEEIAKIPKTDLSNIEKSLNENNSQIELAKGEIIDRINESEIDLRKDVRTTKSELKEDNVKTRNLVRQKTEKIDKNVSKLADRQDLTDKMIEDEAEQIESEIERILNEEADMVENEIYNKEADEIETELNSNQKTDGNDIDNSEG